METKTKIKLLADLSNAAEDEVLLNLIKEMPSGEIVLEVFQQSMLSRIDTLLNGGVQAKTAQQVGEISAVLEKLTATARFLSGSPLMGTLAMIQEQLQGVSLPPQAKQTLAALAEDQAEDVPDATQAYQESNRAPIRDKRASRSGLGGW